MRVAEDAGAEEVRVGAHLRLRVEPRPGVIQVDVPRLVQTAELSGAQLGEGVGHGSLRVVTGAGTAGGRHAKLGPAPRSIKRTRPWPPVRRGGGTGGTTDSRRAAEKQRTRGVGGTRFPPIPPWSWLGMRPHRLPSSGVTAPGARMRWRGPRCRRSPSRRSARPAERPGSASRGPRGRRRRRAPTTSFMRVQRKRMAVHDLRLGDGAHLVHVGAHQRER
jgi:hypothetical protein